MSNFPALTRLTTDTVTHHPAHDRLYNRAPTRPGQPVPLHLRKSQPVTILLPRTRQWLMALPPAVRPRALAMQFARIANLLCASWEHPPDCRRYINDLLIDRRGGRRGFPKPVAREIQVLSEYYCQLYPYLKASTVKLELQER